MPTEPEDPTLAQIVHRAVEVADPEGRDEATAALLARYEDRDEPVTAVADVEQDLAEASGAIDSEGDSPALAMVVATAVYLAYRRTELDDDRESLLRLAARAEFDGHPPENVERWLE